MVKPVGDVLTGNPERSAILHQADVVDVGYLRASDTLIDPTHHVTEDALCVVVQLTLHVLLAQVLPGEQG